MQIGDPSAVAREPGVGDDDASAGADALLDVNRDGHPLDDPPLVAGAALGSARGAPEHGGHEQPRTESE